MNDKKLDEEALNLYKKYNEMASNQNNINKILSDISEVIFDRTKYSNYEAKIIFEKFLFLLCTVPLKNDNSKNISTENY